MRTRGLLLLILAAVAVCIFWPSSAPKENRSSEPIKSDESLQPSPPSIPAGKDLAPAPAPKAPPTPQAQNQEPSELKHMSRDEFIAHFRAQKFATWLAKAEPYKSTSSEAGLNNGVCFDTGVIVSPNGEFEYRFCVAFNEREELKPDSCISIRPPQGDILVGSGADNSLVVYKLPVENARLYRIQDRHFFVTYADMTDSRQGPHGDPTSPLLLQAWLYYTQEANGRFVYQGKRERWGDHTDRRMEMNAEEFCRYSYAPGPGK